MTTFGYRLPSTTQGDNNEHWAYPWFAVQVKPNFESTSATSLTARKLETFLPMYTATRRWSDRLKTSKFPLFPGYLFCRLNPEYRTPVLEVPGVIGIVSCGRQPLPVDEHEIEALRRVSRESISAQPGPFLEAGLRVRVVKGALSGIEGLVIEDKGKCCLVLQVSLLQRSVRVQIDRDWIEPLMAARLKSSIPRAS